MTRPQRQRITGSTTTSTSPSTTTTTGLDDHDHCPVDHDHDDLPDHDDDRREHGGQLGGWRWWHRNADDLALTGMNPVPLVALGFIFFILGEMGLRVLRKRLGRR